VKKWLSAVPLSLMVGVSVQAGENCEGFTQDMTCFENGTAAKADEVNMNFQKLLEKISQIGNGGGGMVSYTRWGRNSCPDGADLIYKGFAASGYYGEGGISSALCLTEDPKFAIGAVNDGNQDGALLYGTEYGTSSFGIASLKPLNNKDIPCAVCLKQVSLTLMIPGTNQCPADWHEEYEGYLMGPRYSHARGEAVCVDIDAEESPLSSDASSTGNWWYPTEAECGSLPCPPYVNNRELSCVVCSK
jgi:hypothetical protein